MYIPEPLEQYQLHTLVHVRPLALIVLVHCLEWCEDSLRNNVTEDINI